MRVSIERKKRETEVGAGAKRYAPASLPLPLSLSRARVSSLSLFFLSFSTYLAALQTCAPHSILRRRPALSSGRRISRPAHGAYHRTARSRASPSPVLAHSKIAAKDKIIEYGRRKERKSRPLLVERRISDLERATRFPSTSSSSSSSSPSRYNRLHIVILLPPFLSTGVSPLSLSLSNGLAVSPRC